MFVIHSKKHYLNILLRHSFAKYRLIRKSSNSKKELVSFDKINAQRRAEAQRSIVVRAESEFCFEKIYEYCENYATIISVQHFKNTAEEMYMIIEFESEENLKHVFQAATAHFKDLFILPTQSPFLFFRPYKNKHQSGKPLDIQYCNKYIDDNTLNKVVGHDTLSKQIQLLYDMTKLSDVSIRLRYVVARQLELIFENLYPHIDVQPFGSSVNGLGRMGSDLDLVLTYNLKEKVTSLKKQLVYQKKIDNYLNYNSKHLRLLADILELRATGVVNVQRVLSARIPIVKYLHSITDLQCDLSFIDNKSCVDMSGLLWMYGSLDTSVRPLAFVVRYWAKSVGLTRPSPGPWITNFSLSLMVVFFLQQERFTSGPILPCLNTVISKYGKENKRTDGNYTCVYDLRRLPTSVYSQSQRNLGELLLKFFEFYSQFDFVKHAICPLQGVPIPKQYNSPLYIVNPLDNTLNVSRNVSCEECARLQLKIRNAAFYLEGTLDNTKSERPTLIKLINNRVNYIQKRKNRLITVQDLFKEETEGSGEPLVKPDELLLSNATAKSST